MVSTREEVSSQSIHGNRTSGVSWNPAAISSQARASTMKSSSALSDLSNSSTMAGTSMSAKVREARVSRPVRVRRISRSAVTFSTTPGLRTFTTTSRPSRSRAACTWPTEAVASGRRSNSVNSSSTPAPKSSSIVRATASKGTAAVLSVRRANAAM